MFDEQPDGDPHGECAAEIHRLEAENAKLLAACRKALGVLAGEDMNKQALIDALSMCRTSIAAATGQKGE